MAMTAQERYALQSTLQYMADLQLNGGTGSGGDISGTGTSGTLAVFTGAKTLGNSLFSQSGNVGTLAGTFNVASGSITANAPALNLSQTWNNGAVAFTGITLNVTDTASDAASYLMDLKLGGSSRFQLTKAGSVTLSSSGSLTIGSTGFFRWGSDVRLYRDAANTLALRDLANAQTWNVYGTTDSGALNYRRLRTTMTTAGAATIAAEGLGTEATGNTLAFKVNAVTALSFGTSGISIFGASVIIPSVSAYYWLSRSLMFSPADSEILLQRNNQTDADFFLKLGVNTSAAAGIKRVGTVLQARLNDDSGFATIQGKIRTDTAYVAGVVTDTGTITITDSTGTAYRVLCAP